MRVSSSEATIPHVSTMTPSCEETNQNGSTTIPGTKKVRNPELLSKFSEWISSSTETQLTPKTQPGYQHPKSPSTARTQPQSYPPISAGSSSNTISNSAVTISQDSTSSTKQIIKDY